MIWAKTSGHTDFRRKADFRCPLCKKFLALGDFFSRKNLPNDFLGQKHLVTLTFVKSVLTKRPG
jgi:hypothetical protein